MHFLWTLVISTIATRAPSSVLLNSGEHAATHEVPVAQREATVWFSFSTEDNVVAATPKTTAHAHAMGAKSYNPPETFYATSKDARVAAAASFPFLRDYELDATVIPLQTFWSATLNDTLTTASPSGLAWAKDPANGYELLGTEGYCLSQAPPVPARSPQILAAVQYTQLWSDARHDSFLVAVGGSHEKTGVSAKYVHKWSECWVLASSVPGATGLWTTWDDKPQPGIPWPRSKDLLGWEYLSGANPGYGGGDHTRSSADTWYPSWAADNKLYTSFTDGTVHDDNTGTRTKSGSGGHTGHGYNSTTGFAVIIGDDPFGLNVTHVGTFTSSTFPYQGRYPCGQLAYKGNWWYGTYYLDNPNAAVGGNYVGPNPKPNCGNWCVQGPMVDFRLSTDAGQSWAEPRLNGSMANGKGDDNLFGETAAHNQKVKFGAPHFVDFGQELEHSPDGKAYLVGHGASRPEAIQAWMLGDEVYMARVTPDAASIADRSKWEFYAGGHGDSAQWVQGDVSKAAPLVTWNNHTGVVTMTYFAAIRKFVLCIGTASFYPSMTRQFDTYFLESDSITGPWSYVNYNSEFGPEAYFVHHPSKFLAQRANTSDPAGPHYDAFLMYSANFAFRDGSTPPNSGYHMNLQQARFPLSKKFAQRLSEWYKHEDESVADLK